MTGTDEILVTGATGQQGGAVARHLLQRGRAVRALVRDPSSPTAVALRNLGARLTVGDFDDLESLRAAAKGVYGIFSVQPVSFGQPDAHTDEVRQGRNVAQVAAEAKVQHLIYSSVGGAERDSKVPHFESKWQIEQEIDTLGVPATIVRPVFFYENLRQFGATVQGGELVVRLGLEPDVALQMIALDDIGGIVATMFQDRPAFLGHQLEVAGDALTGPQIAAALGATAGLPARFEQTPAEQLRGFSEDMALMFEFFNQRGYAADIAAVRRLRPQMQTFADWLAAGSWTAPQH